MSNDGHTNVRDLLLEPFDGFRHFAPHLQIEEYSGGCRVYHQVIYMVHCTYKKRMRQFEEKKLRRFLIRTHATLLWFASEFLPNEPQFGKHATFSRQKASQSLNCSALQDGALQCSHQSAGHPVGEKQCTWRRVFKCSCDAFVVFFLTRTLCRKMYSKLF